MTVTPQTEKAGMGALSGSTWASSKEQPVQYHRSTYQEKMDLRKTSRTKQTRVY